jgi:hypothetical protein
MRAYQFSPGAHKGDTGISKNKGEQSGSPFSNPSNAAMKGHTHVI